MTASSLPTIASIIIQIWNEFFLPLALVKRKASMAERSLLEAGAP